MEPVSQTSYTHVTSPRAACKSKPGKGRGSSEASGRGSRAFRRGHHRLQPRKPGSNTAPSCSLTVLPRITFLLEERDEELSHGPAQDLTGRPRHHMMTDTPDPWKTGVPCSAPGQHHSNPHAPATVSKRPLVALLSCWMVLQRPCPQATNHH